jgi:NitT/TauT family transport system ATP-binding protein
MTVSRDAAVAASRLEVRDLVKRYVDSHTQDHVLALEHVDFEVRPGEFVALLGPSGCGKTTILNIVAGFVKPTSGEVLLDGTAVTDPGADRGVVFQSFALFPWKTVRANVAFGPKMRGVGRRERNDIADSYLRLVGLEGFENRFPHELSGGMQQRVGVARVLANEPSLMLMDEPFASVDAQTRMGLQEEITRIWEEQRPTIMFVTHDVEEAVFLADRIVVLAPHPGRVREIVDVPLDRPRTWDAVLGDPHFKQTVQHVLGLLKSAPRDVEGADGSV